MPRARAEFGLLGRALYGRQLEHTAAKARGVEADVVEREQDQRLGGRRQEQVR